MDRELIARLGGWEGYRVGTVERYEASESCPVAQVWIELLRKPGPWVCSGCGQTCDRCTPTVQGCAPDVLSCCGKVRPRCHRSDFLGTRLRRRRGVP